MAYGVKYRLDFSDAQGNKRRLEILKKIIQIRFFL